MTTPYSPRPIAVRGGAGGIEAHYDDMVALARLFGRAALELADTSMHLQRYLFDPGLVSGGVLDPVGGLDFAAEFGIALDGPGGLTWVAARCGVNDLKLRAAAAAYRLEDELLARVEPVALGVLKLPRAAVEGAATFVTTGDVTAGAGQFLSTDPELADDLVTAIGGVDGRAEGAAAAVVPDGAPLVKRLGVDPLPEASTPPRSLYDLMSALALRDNACHGAIDVRLLTRADGTRAAIVDIPGTKSWQVLPNGDITSMATNLRAIRGASTGYERGVLLAMRQAGVRPTDDVMLVGHSEGGMVAVTAAIDANASGRFRVTHVVTAGAPIGAVTGRIPSDVEVLALENKHDLVPHLDGRTNDDRVNVVTATFDRDLHGVGSDHHVLTSYLPGAADVDASDNTSVRAFLASASGFFDAEHVSTERFVITRAH